MATESDAGRSEATASPFGSVDKTVGRLFEGTLLGATLLAIVALAVLLAYVTADAVRPFTADPGWLAVFLATVLVPAVAVGWATYRRVPGALGTGAMALGIPAIGLLFGGGAALLFVDVVSPVVWFAFFFALTVPLAVSGALYVTDVDVPFTAWLAIAVLGTAASLAVVPGLVQGLPFLPSDWVIMVLTLGLPAAVFAGHYVASTWESRRRGLLGGGLVFVGVALAAFVGPLLGVSPVPAVVFAVVAVVPTAVYVATVVAFGGRRRWGLGLTATVVVGAATGLVVTGLLGFAGPESWVDWQFLTSDHSQFPARAGLYPAIAGTIMLMGIVTAVSFPLGVGAAVYLEEYAPENRWTRLIRVNISNLAGVPSVVYGLLGLGVFVTYLGDGIPVVPPILADGLGIEPLFVAGSLFSPGTVFVGGLTLSLLILPIIIISAQEAIAAVPEERRQASFGMGATRWQTVRNVVLPEAFPGILTGTILALGRAIGETAPLIMILAPNVFDLPRALASPVGAMPLQIYAWATLFAKDQFLYRVLPAGVVVLVVTMLAMNSIAIVLRNKFQQPA